MKSSALGFIVTCAAFTIVGLIGGFMAAQQTSSSGSGHGDHGGEEETADGDHEGHDHAEEGGPVISPQAVKNLGLEFVDIELTSFSTYRSIPAVIRETPLTVQPLFSPIGGVVKEVRIKHGSVIDGGVVAITLFRDSIARLNLNLTSALLDPERRLKGLTIKEIASLESESSTERQLHLWILALKRNGFWPEITDATYQVLPQDMQALPFSAAALGELTANGLLTEDLLRWFESDQRAGRYLFEIASLLVQGKGLSYVQNLYALGALDSTIEIRTPATADDWDIHGIFVKPGEHVEMGDELASLHNPRQLHLVAHAKGSEIAILIKALEDSAPITAVALTEGASPILTGLEIRNLQDEPDGRGGAVVHLEVVNNPSIINEDESGTRYRSWKVRVGSKYMLRVPQTELNDVYVLASDAVISDGPDQVVYVQDGDNYNPAKVVVVYSDEEVVVLNQESEIFPDDSVVNRGAFGLDIALKAGTSGAVDAHAGHGH